MNCHSLIAQTPHGRIEYGWMTKFIGTEIIEPHINKARFDDLCRRGCPNYNHKWSCPPFAPKFLDFVKPYQYILVVLLSVNMDEFDYIKQDYMKIRAANSILKSRMDKALRQSKSDGEFYVSTGSCRLCRSCKRKRDEHCAHPQERTFSFEAMGVNVSSLAMDLFQKRLLWYRKGALPQYTCVVGGLLTNNQIHESRLVACLESLR